MLSAVAAELELVQHLSDRPHLARNVAANFPELKLLGENLKKLLDSVFYARTSQKLESALVALDAQWETVKPTIATQDGKPPGDMPPGDMPRDEEADSESDNESPLERNRRPRTIIERLENQLLRDYIEIDIDRGKFCVAEMKESNGDVPSSNSAEAQGSYLRNVRSREPSLP